MGPATGGGGCLQARGLNQCPHTTTKVRWISAGSASTDAGPVLMQCCMYASASSLTAISECGITDDASFLGS